MKLVATSVTLQDDLRLSGKYCKEVRWGFTGQVRPSTRPRHQYPKTSPSPWTHLRRVQWHSNQGNGGETRISSPKGNLKVNARSLVDIYVLGASRKRPPGKRIFRLYMRILYLMKLPFSFFLYICLLWSEFFLKFWKNEMQYFTTDLFFRIYCLVCRIKYWI